MPDYKTISVRLVGDGTGLSRSLTTASGEVRNFERQVNQSNTAVASSTSKMKAGWADAADLAGKAGRQMSIGITLPLVAIGGAAVHASNNFDEAFSRMVGLAGVSRDEIGKLKDSVLELAGDTGRAPQELADGLYFIESAGLHGATAMDALTVSAKAAEAGMGDTASVADALTSAISAYGSANLSASKAGDILVAAVRDGKAEAADLVPVLGRLLPAAVALKVPFQDVAAGVSYLSRTFTADEAATAYAGVLRSLLNPSQQATMALADVGLSVQALQDIVAKQGVLAALQLLQQKLGGSSVEMSQVFEDSRALNGALALLTNGGKDAAQVFADTANSANSLDLAVGAIAGDDATKARKAIASLQVDLIRLGEAIAPLVTSVLGFAATAVEAFMSLPEPARNALLVFAGLLAIAGPLGIAFSRVYGFIKLVQSGFDLARTAILAHISATAADAEVMAAEALAAQGVATAEGEAALVAAGLATNTTLVSDAMIASALAEGEAALAAAGLLGAEQAAAVGATELATAELAAATAAETASVGFQVALGPLGVLAAAVGAVIVAFNVFGDSGHEAKQVTVDYTEALKDQNGLLEDNIDLVSLHALTQDEAARKANQLGLTYASMLRVIRDGSVDFDRLDAALSHVADDDTIAKTAKGAQTLGGALRDAGLESTDFGRQLIALADSGKITKDDLVALLDSVGGLAGKYRENKAAFDAETGAVKELGLGVQGTTPKIAELGGATDQLGDIAKAAADKIQKLIDTQHAQVDPLFALSKALRDNAEAQFELAKGGGDLAEKQQRVAETAQQVNDAEQRLSDMVKNGNITFQQAVDQLQLWVNQGLMTQQTADGIRDRLYNVLVKMGELDGSRADMQLSLDDSEALYAIARVLDQIARLKAAAQIGPIKVSPGLGAIPSRWGNVFHSYAGGGIEQAGIGYSTMIKAFEPETGGEAYVPRRGDYSRSMGILREAAGWYGADVMPRMLRGTTGASGMTVQHIVINPTAVGEPSAMSRAQMARDTKKAARDAARELVNASPLVG